MTLTKVTTGLIGNLAVDTENLADNAVDGSKISVASEAQGDLLWYDGTNWARVPKGTAGQLLQGNATSIPTWTSGHIVQVVNTQTGAVATGTTLMVADDTIPQNTEGDQYMTLAITPSNTSNKLLIEVLINLSHATAGGRFIIALFQDSTASAVAAVANHSASAQVTETIILRHYMAAGTTSATTFKVRAGETGSGTTTFNGSGGSRELGGVMASSITITEISA